MLIGKKARRRGRGVLRTGVCLAPVAALWALPPSAAQAVIPVIHYQSSSSSIYFNVGDPSLPRRGGTVSSPNVISGDASSHLQSGDIANYVYYPPGYMGGPGGVNIDSFAGGETGGTANYGKLTAYAHGGMSLDISGTSTSTLPAQNYNNLSASTTSTFVDVLIYKTLDPLGSDIKFDVGLESTVSASGTFNPVYLEDGGFTAAASAGLQVRTNDDEPFFLSTTDSISQYVDLGYSREHIFYQAKTMHIDYDTPTVILLIGQLSAGVGGNNASAAMDAEASHTALFAVSSDDPLASYTSDSGTVYATSVPEPAAAAFFCVGAFTLSRRRNRRT